MTSTSEETKSSLNPVVYSPEEGVVLLRLTKVGHIGGLTPQQPPPLCPPQRTKKNE
jgi:hypothetical protein